MVWDEGGGRVMVWGVGVGGGEGEALNIKIMNWCKQMKIARCDAETNLISHYFSR